MSHLLKIKITDDCPNREFVINYYQNQAKKIGYARDCGIDLIFPQVIEFTPDTVTGCNLGIICEFYHDDQNQLESDPFRIVPRSSISKTPLMLANSEGIIDPGYRGPIIAAFRCFTIPDPYSYQVKPGDRLVQIVAPDLNPIKIELVDEVTQTDRGSGGFGSTNISA